MNTNIQVCVNTQQWVGLNRDEPLQVLIEKLALGSEKIAVAVNNNIINQAKWHDYLMQDNDQVSVFSAIAGG